MIITKYIHSCLLVETAGRVAVVDPGSMSYPVFDFSKLTRLDDILITHIHQDHFHLPFIEQLVISFPDVKITTTPEVVEQLNQKSIQASDQPSDGITFFDSPHESVAPVYPLPQQVGFHYLDTLTVPGDSHSFKETKNILALPITAPWGGSIQALRLALQLKPKYLVPVHDWHWSDQARNQTYDRYAQLLAEQDITMLKPVTGQTMDIKT